MTWEKETATGNVIASAFSGPTYPHFTTPLYGFVANVDTGLSPEKLDRAELDFLPD